MFKPAGIAVGLALVLGAQSVVANDVERILGVWRLISSQTEYQATGEKEFTRGRNAAAFLIFTREGRMMAVLTNEGRKPASTDQERAELFNTMVAYTGVYRMEADKWVTKVDVAWNPALVGTEQPRFYRLEGDELQEVTPWSPRAERGMARAVNLWQRVK